MTRCVFAIPGDIDQPTGGYTYARRVIELLPQLGVTVTHVALPGSFPLPDGADLAAAAAALAAVPPSAVLVIDGLAFGALPAAVLARLAAPVVAVIHHPLGWESGLAPAQRAALLDSERAALNFARRVVVCSRTTAEALAGQFGYPAGRVVVAEPGTDPAPPARGSGGPPHLLAVGAVVPRKGYDVLVAALAGLAGLDWRATIVGSLDRDPAAAAALARQVAAAGLDDRIRLAGALAPAALDESYASADLFVMASRYEGYGMAMAEAMARGLPVVHTTGGAAAETVPPTAGLAVPPDDANALREALRRLICEEPLRRALAEGARRASATLPRWEDTATLVARAITDVAGERAAG